MAIVINGSGTVTGLAVGGLPDGTVDAGTVAADVATQAELDAKTDATKVPLAGGTMTGSLSQVSTTDNTVMTHTISGDHNNTTIQGSSGSAGSQLVLKNTDTTDNNFSSVNFQDAQGNTVSGVLGINKSHSSNQGELVFFVRGGIHTDGDEAMRIDHNGTVTMPSQPAFSAQTSGGFSLSSKNTLLTIPYNTERFDQNADFNTSTYTFTAPVTGKYQFNVITRLDNVDSGATYYHVYFVTSNRTYYDIFDPRGFDQDLGYLGLTVPCLADMDANDTAIVKIYQAGGVVQTTMAGTTDSHFSGYLVC